VALLPGGIEGACDGFVDAALRQGPRLRHESPARKRDYLERLTRGGFPEAVARNPRRRAAVYESDVTSLVERGVSELAVIERRGGLRRLLALLAGRNGTLLVQSALATISGVPWTTLVRYLEAYAEPSLKK
jgi:predicted AAA+ superfamily ATPase